MSKLEVIEGKQTSWEGLWWHPEYQGFSSGVISLAQLRKFKGNVRLYMRKNKYYENGKNNRPNYTWCLKDANSATFKELEVEDDVDARLYTEDELQTAIAEAVEKATNDLYTRDQLEAVMEGARADGARGYGYGDVLIEDYI